MNLTNLQKKKIRAKAQRLKANFQIGKNDITDEMVKTIIDGLEAHELVKISILNNTSISKETVVETLTDVLNPEYIYMIGKQVVVYKQSSKKEKQKLSLEL